MDKRGVDLALIILLTGRMKGDLGGRFSERMQLQEEKNSTFGWCWCREEQRELEK